MKNKSRRYHDYLIESLKNPSEAAAYLNAALEEKNDPEAFLMALRNVAQAHGVADTANKARLNRESFYRMLSHNGNPKISSLFSVLEAFGLTLRIQQARG